MNGKIKLDIGCGFTHLTDYTRIDKDPRTEPDVLCDIAEPEWIWLFASETVDEIRIHDVMEHFPQDVCMRLMGDFHHLLKPGGKLDIQVPSTDGRGAFQNPLHKSFWNRNTFYYYTLDHCVREIGFPGKFEIELILDRQTDINVIHTRAILRKGQYGNNTFERTSEK